MVNTNHLMVLDQNPAPSTTQEPEVKSNLAFIEANTIDMSLSEISERHIIPVFSSTNEPLISHSEFINILWEAASQVFRDEVLFEPVIRVSHPVKGRIPEAKSKPAIMLDPWEETLFYERAMFIIEIPTIMEDVNGNMLSLTIGGVKAYNLDSIYTKRPNQEQNFKMFIGFKNRVCCNLCVWSDGFVHEVGIKTISQLRHSALHMIQAYDAEKHLKNMKSLNQLSLSETEFAQVIGRSRMFKHIPEGAKNGILPVLLGDQQLGAVVRDYYKDPNFCQQEDSTISLWRLYNLMTGANKSSYIDQFIDRTVNVTDFITEIGLHKTNQKGCWYMG